MSHQSIETASIGTRAPAIGGGAWCKTERGWKWNGPHGCGGTFPRPGGDWTGNLIEEQAWLDAHPHYGHQSNSSEKVQVPHSPLLPWHVVEHSWETISVADTEGTICTLHIGDVDEDTEIEGESQMHEHAHLIVRAVNNHADLLAALTALVQLDDAERASGVVMYAKGSPVWKAWKAARTAIQRATT